MDVGTINKECLVRKNVDSGQPIDDLGSQSKEVGREEDITVESSNMNTSSNSNNAATTTTTTTTKNSSSIDFIGCGGAVKDLFTLPYSTGVSVNVAVHNMGGGTLLLDWGCDMGASSASSSQSSSATSGMFWQTSPSSTRPSAADSVVDRHRRLQLVSMVSSSSSVQRLLAQSEESSSSSSSAENRSIVQSLSPTQFFLSQNVENYEDSGQDSTRGGGSMRERVSPLVTAHKEGRIVESPPSQSSAFGPTAIPATTSSGPFWLPHPSEEGAHHGTTNRSSFTASTAQKSHTVFPLEERPYVRWNFRQGNFDFLVASDALVYRAPSSSSSQKSQQQPHSCALRVLDAPEFSRQVERHRQMVRDGSFVTDAHRERLDRAETYQQQQHHHHHHSPPKPSYAAVVRASPHLLRGAEETKEGFALEDCDNEDVVVVDDDDDDDVDDEDSRYVSTLVHEAGMIRGLSLSESSAWGAGASPGGGSDGGGLRSSSASPAVSTCMDAYLDNIMANVPQLALCLQEKGFIQSVRLLRTQDIPTHMMRSEVVGSGGGVGGSGGGATGNGTGGSGGDAHHGDNGGVGGDSNEPMFSPSIMDLNATMLLRFLKQNCSSENSTYLLRREAGDREVRLYDVTAMSGARQRKWTWWLAMMSYRFALRLSVLARPPTTSSSGQKGHQESGAVTDAALRRRCRDRERSLLRTSLDLLMELSDMDGGNCHETIRASVNDMLAETYLAEAAQGGGSVSSATSNTASRSHSRDRFPSSVGGGRGGFVEEERLCCEGPYGGVSVDGLNKSQRYVSDAIKTLWPLLETAWRDNAAANTQMNRLKLMEEEEEKKRRDGVANKRHYRRRRRPGINNRPNTHPPQDDEEKIEVEGESRESRGLMGGPMDLDSRQADMERHKADYEASRFRVGAVSSQLFGLHRKLVDLSLQSAEIHLRNYGSSSAMQALRTSARGLADAASLLPISKDDHDLEGCFPFHKTSVRQYVRLWEGCGHFARSFAADVERWRERGHACGDDVVGLLRDVQSVCGSFEGQLGLDLDPTTTNADNQKEHGNSNGNGDGDNFLTRATLDDLDGLMLPLSPTKKKDQSNNDNNSHDNNGHDDNVNDHDHVDDYEFARGLLNGKPQLKRDSRRVLVASAFCYGRAIRACDKIALLDNNDEDEYSEGEFHDIEQEKEGIQNLSALLRKRLGDSCNEVGKILLSVVKDASSSDRSRAWLLLQSAERWFVAGLNLFEVCGDVRNVALLRCNLCQCCKVRSNARFPSLGKSLSSKSLPKKEPETSLQEATDHLNAAHVALGHRGIDPHGWDRVSEELAATCLVLGVRRRQQLFLKFGSVRTQIKPTPGEERSIVGPMSRALSIYGEVGNRHQEAAVHYQLALWYAKVWTVQRDAASTRAKLSAAFDHYGHAHKYFRSRLLSTNHRPPTGNHAHTATRAKIDDGPTYVVLCLDLSRLYASVLGSGGAASHECTLQALGCCLDTMDAFSGIPNDNDNDVIIDHETDRKRSEQPQQLTDEWRRTMDTLATTVEDRVLELLKTLVQTAPDDDNGKDEVCRRKNRYKDMYREALTYKMAAPMKTPLEDDSGDNCLHTNVNETKDYQCPPFRVHGLLTRLKLKL